MGTATQEDSAGAILSVAKNLVFSTRDRPLISFKIDK